MSSPPPKSCLKRSSFPTTSRPLFLEPESASSSAEGSSAVFECDTDSTSDRGSQESWCTPSFSSSEDAPRERRKSVSFREDDQVRVFYPPRDPLRKQVARVIKACAEALRIESPYSPPGSRRASVSSVESVEEEDEV
ncbi:hypothetical protein BV20DRAFT_335797 [Pilatotrama ljubarskyi]|nr:hypothetical protein BV20DRAFT_335797 [Pilatotrama ljubarskyi]